jgi:hypothetical protein
MTFDSIKPIKPWDGVKKPARGGLHEIKIFSLKSNPAVSQGRNIGVVPNGVTSTVAGHLEPVQRKKLMPNAYRDDSAIIGADGGSWASKFSGVVREFCDAGTA